MISEEVNNSGSYLYKIQKAVDERNGQSQSFRGKSELCVQWQNPANNSVSLETKDLLQKKNSYIRKYMIKNLLQTISWMCNFTAWLEAKFKVKSYSFRIEWVK